MWEYQPTPNSSKPSCGVSSPQSRQKRKNRSHRSRRVLEELGYWWFEEPVQYCHVKTMGEVSRRLDITVSAGEQTYTLSGLTDLIGAGVRTVQPGIVKMGGISGMLRCPP
jgi:L-alanine-DL-glutamate epimerase-like enolase superfamily enzyme